MEARHNMNTLPLDLVVDIITRLPVKQLLRLRCVSKWWNSEIISPSFSKLYQQRRKGLDASNSESSSIIMVSNDLSILSFDFHTNILKELPGPPNFKVFDFVCSCNGLLLFAEPHPKPGTYSLYNPLTGAYACIPPLVIDFIKHTSLNHSMRCVSPCIGFGYDYHSDDYKILRFIQYSCNESFCTRYPEEAYIYSLKTNSWKIIKDYPTDRHPFRTDIVYCNNALHWITAHIETPEDKIIAALDLGTERCYSFPKPDGQFMFLTTKLAALKGCLHLLSNDHSSYDFDFKTLDIWIMREYGVKRPWTKLFRYSSSEFDEVYRCFDWPQVNITFPSAYSEDGEGILVRIGSSPPAFVSFNLRSGETRNIEFGPIIRASVRWTVPWVPSLAHPCTL